MGLHCRSALRQNADIVMGTYRSSKPAFLVVEVYQNEKVLKYRYSDRRVVVVVDFVDVSSSTMF